MMKRFLVSLAFIAFAISAAAAQLPAVLKAEPDGSVQLGNIGMYVIHIGEQWAGSMQRSLNPDEKDKNRTGSDFCFRFLSRRQFQ